MCKFLFTSCCYIFLFCNLSACATLSKDQCTVGDWHAIGKTDGEYGRQLKYFEKHQAACLNYKIKANKPLYLQGRALGLQSYCKIQHQINLGIKGERYRPVCSGGLVPLLREANQAGYRVFTVMNDLKDTSSQIEDVRSQMRSKNIKDAERERLEEEENRLQDQANRLLNEVDRLKTEGEKTLTRKARAYYKRS